MLRALTILIAVLIFLVVAAALLLPMLIDEDQLVSIASEQLEKQTGAVLEVRGGASVSLFPTVRLSLADASLTLPNEDPTRVELRSLQFGIELIPLLTSRVEIEQLILDGLVAVLPVTAPPPPSVNDRLSDAELESFYAERRRAIEEAGRTAGQDVFTLMVPEVEKLTITDSRLERVNTESGERSVVELRLLEATGVKGDNSPIPLQAQLVVPGEQPVELSLESELRIDQGSGEMAIDSLVLRLTGATAEPLTVEASGKADLRRQTADLALELKVSETRAEGSLRYAAFESPRIDADLKMNLLDPALLVLAGPEAAGAAGSGPADGEAASGGDQPLPLEPLRSIDTRAVLRIDRARFGNHEITDVAANLRAVDGNISLGRLTGEVHGGKLAMEAGFNARLNTAKLDSRGTLQGLELASLLTALEAGPIADGIADTDWNLSGSGATANELIASLKGPINLDAAETVLQDIAVERMMCQVVALANQESLSAEFPASSTFDTLGARIKLEDGKAKLTPLKASLPGITLTGEGRVLLLEGTFRGRFAARLSRELEQLDPACTINERYTSIDWPLECKGELAGDPGDWCSVDSEQILADLAKSEVRRRIEKEAGKLFDKFRKN